MTPKQLMGELPSSPPNAVEMFTNALHHLIHEDISNEDRLEYQRFVGIIIRTFFRTYNDDERWYLLTYVYILLYRYVDYGQKTSLVMTHSLVCILFLIASKVLDDEYFTNELWAKNLRIPLRTFNYLETECLYKLQFHTFVRQEQLRDAAVFLYPTHRVTRSAPIPLLAPMEVEL